jgi:4-hydroxy-tetrahydrodipicolinate synthase
LFRAVQANDLAEARRLNDRIYPLACVFYADPWADMHNRMKEALVLLGRLPRAVVRPPLVKLARAEIDRIHVALVKAGLLSAKTTRAMTLPLPESSPLQPSTRELSSQALLVVSTLTGG